MNKIVKMYWNCPYCETADIDGLVDECPNCGRHKPENTKYHLNDGIIATRCRLGITYKIEAVSQ